jgi:leucyl aminopeptidase (aminopeptidase T)
MTQYDRFPELYHFAKKPFELNAESSDTVAIVTDSKIDRSVKTALFTAAAELNLDPTVMEMLPRQAHGLEPTDAIGAAIKDADLTVFAASTALAHTKASIATQQQCNGVILMSEVTADILTGGAVRADYEAMNEQGSRIKESWDNGERVHVTCPNGTYLHANIEGRRCWLLAGKLFHVDDVGKHVAAFPDGEAGIAPVEGSGEGKIVFDATAHHVGQIDGTITIEVNEGWATSISGGPSAKKFEHYIEQNGDENSWQCPAEISIGLNPMVEFTGNLRTDKKKYGTVHVALGESESVLDGTVPAALHLDGVISNPTVTIDEEQIVENGKIVV